MPPDISLDTLWSSALASGGTFSSQHTARLPEPARRLLDHAIAPNTWLASAVRLRMHGEIKIGRWMPFTAEQVIRRDGNMLWCATVSAFAIPLFRGFDRLVDGVGKMRWALFGLVPFINASGSDVSHSAIGRVQAESIWLPSLFCRDDVSWATADDARVLATVRIAGNTPPTELTIDPAGRLASVRVSRWGNPPPDTKHFRLLDFGGVCEAERTFGGYTIPSRVRVGWHFGSPEFDSVGEFFRATVDDAVFR